MHKALVVLVCVWQMVQEQLFQYISLLADILNGYSHLFMG